MHVRYLLAAQSVTLQHRASAMQSCGHLGLPSVGQQVGIEVVVERCYSLVHGVAAGPASHGSFVSSFVFFSTRAAAICEHTAGVGSRQGAPITSSGARWSTTVSPLACLHPTCTWRSFD